MRGLMGWDVTLRTVLHAKNPVRLAGTEDQSELGSESSGISDERKAGIDPMG